MEKQALSEVCSDETTTSATDLLDMLSIPTSRGINSTDCSTRLHKRAPMHKYQSHVANLDPNLVKAHRKEISASKSWKKPKQSMIRNGVVSVTAAERNWKSNNQGQGYRADVASLRYKLKWYEDLIAANLESNRYPEMNQAYIQRAIMTEKKLKALTSNDPQFSKELCDIYDERVKRKLSPMVKSLVTSAVRKEAVKSQGLDKDSDKYLFWTGLYNEKKKSQTAREAGITQASSSHSTVA